MDGIDTAATDSGSLSARIQARLPQLRGALRKLALQVLDDPAAVTRSTITELGEASGTSPGTVQRFCRMLGLSGYSELRLGIAAESGSLTRAGWDVTIGTEITPGDTVEHVQQTIFAADLWAMRQTISQLDPQALERAIDAVARAHRVNLYGVGNSSIMAHQLFERLHGIGRPAWAWSEVHSGLASAALMQPSDVAIAISYTGSTREVVEMLAEAAGRRATTIALTNSPDSPLADIADIVLTTAVRETTFRPGSFAAQHSQLLLIDILYVGVAQRTYEQANSSLRTTRHAVEVHRGRASPVSRRRAGRGGDGRGRDTSEVDEEGGSDERDD